MALPHSTVLSDASECWPPIRLKDWQDTYATLHMWTQIVGKIRLELTPKVNHWWNVPLYLSSRGLSTSLIPYRDRTFDMEFDFVQNQLVVRTSDPETASVALRPQSVADFYRQLMAALRSLGIEVNIWKMPVEVADPIPFDQDHRHNSYDAEQVRRLRSGPGARRTRRGGPQRHPRKPACDRESLAPSSPCGRRQHRLS